MSSTRTPGFVEREKHHFQNHCRYILHFLAFDKNRFDRWLIRQVLKTWDRQIAFLDPTLIKDKVVLEAGCGNPRFLFLFKQMGAKEAIGCDLAHQFVALGLGLKHTFVHVYNPPTDEQEIRLIYGDVNGPVTEGVRADTITCFQTLHHLDLPKFAATCHRLLTPGGHVAISDPTLGHPLRRLGNWVGRISGLLSPDERALSPKQVTSEFERLGFTRIAYRPLNPTLEIFFQMTELLSPLSTRAAFYAKLPMVVLRPLEDLLEGTIVRLFPRLGWRYFLVFKKNSDSVQ
jgi:SAM-dependent methyltransferase